jgi:hypothetical protein
MICGCREPFRRRSSLPVRAPAASIRIRNCCVAATIPPTHCYLTLDAVVIAMSHLPAVVALLILFTGSVAATDEPDRAKSKRSAQGDAPALREAGWLQSIRLEPHRVRVTAKLDTGAKSSAIHAVDVERFERGGVERVKFSLFQKHTDQDGTKITYDLPIVGKVRIKRAAEKVTDERITVRLSFCIDGELMDAKFSLDDRSNLNYPVLLGREFLKEHFLVDSSKTFVFPSECPAASDKN